MQHCCYRWTETCSKGTIHHFEIRLKILSYASLRKNAHALTCCIERKERFDIKYNMKKIEGIFYNTYDMLTF